jgi:hypothetical protein
MNLVRSSLCKIMTLSIEIIRVGSDNLLFRRIDLIAYTLFTSSKRIIIIALNFFVVFMNPKNMQVMSFTLYKKSVNSSSFNLARPPLIDSHNPASLSSLLGVNLYITLWMK